MATKIRAENISPGDRLILREGVGPSTIIGYCQDEEEIRVYFVDDIYLLFRKDELVEIE
jgi:hypothetical protein